MCLTCQAFGGTLRYGQWRSDPYKALCPFLALADRVGWDAFKQVECLLAAAVTVSGSACVMRAPRACSSHRLHMVSA